MDKETVFRLARETKLPMFSTNDEVNDMALLKFAALIEAELKKEAALCAGAKPYAHEFGRSNGDGTFSVVIDRGQPERACSDWPIKPLYTHAQPQADTAELERQLAEEKSARIKGDDANTLLRRQLADSDAALRESRANDMEAMRQLSEAQSRIAQLEDILQLAIIGSCTCQARDANILSDEHSDDCRYKIFECAFSTESSTWLAKHDNEVLERAANVCDEYADDPVYCGSAIRALKTEVR